VPSRRNALLLAGMVAVAVNLRPAASSVGPVLDGVRDGLGLSSTAASALLALPLVCFGAMALLAPLVASRLGFARAIGFAMLILSGGLVLRVAGDVPALYVGTFLAGASIAVVNVLLPVLVKRRFGTRTGAATTVYSTAMIGSASLASGITVPIEHWLGGGWRVGLGVWAVPAALAFLFWAPQLRGSADHAATPVPLGAALRLWRDPVARQLTLFFGLQAASFYAILSWLPTILKAQGIGATDAGVLLAVSALMGLPGALLIPGIAVRARNQRFLALALCCSTATGFVGLIAAPTAVPLLWAVLIGIGQGASFPLALTLIVLRSDSVETTTALSTLTQGCGYLIAACGPLALGAVHDLTGSWSAAVALLLALLVPQALAGLGAGRAVHVGVAR
jgi:CP family cyanate transporter-like MFS transporter